jgi:hypothetical protein
VGVFNYKDIYCEMKQLIRHILREHTREISEMRKLTTPEFIEKAKAVHGDKYDYSNTKYKGAQEDVKIICPKHGEFTTTPNIHISHARGCQKCGKENQVHGLRSNSNEFIKKAKSVHGDKYDYSKVNYVKNSIPVTITCPTHGDFEQRPDKHLVGRGCQKCKGGIRSNTGEFIQKAKEIHGDRYNYSQVEYKNQNTPVTIICPEHGDFLQKPTQHLNGAGCQKCGGNYRYNTNEFIDLAKEVHGDRFDYSKTIYKNNSTPIVITCPKPNHGDFTQWPNHHLKGVGCPHCSESKGEKLVSEILKKNKISFLRQHRFGDCTNNKQGKFCVKLPFDFYLPNKNICIEYDGKQHFQPVNMFGGDESFEGQVLRDKIKDQYCKKNGIKLIRIPYTMKKEEIEPYILKELGIK